MAGRYHATPTIVDGIRFASRAESRRYEVLRDMQERGEISDLKLQGRHKIVVNGMPICVYIDDFSYLDSSGARVYEDVKGARTPVFILKKKLVKACHGIDIVEVRA